MRKDKNNKIGQTLIDGEQGSTSVLIVIMMIVLMAFGMAALTTAYAGYRLSEKNAEFNSSYYALESKAYNVKFDLIEIMLETKKEALELAGIEDEIIYKGTYLELVYEKLYSYARIYEGLTIESDLDYLYQIEQDPTFKTIGRVRYYVKEDKNLPKYIEVQIELYIPKMKEQNTSEDLTTVLYWYQWQEGIGNVNEDIFFEDPFENPDENPEENPEEDTEVPYFVPQE